MGDLAHEGGASRAWERPVTAHHCHAIGCDRTVPPKMFACLRHWRMVPAKLQRLLWASYVPGQERTKDPTVAYLAVHARCRLAIAEAESLPPATLAVIRAELARWYRHLLAADAPDRLLTDDQLIAAFDAAFKL